MLAFTVVGSTKFDALVQAVLSQSVLTALRLQGYTTLVVQCGKSLVNVNSSATTAAGDIITLRKNDIDIEIWSFKPSLEADYSRADLVISHAGTSSRQILSLES